MLPVAGTPSLDDLRATGDPGDVASVEVAADDAATIVYTSGTTGPPKGCVLTHANCIATMRMYEDRLRDELEPRRRDRSCSSRSRTCSRASSQLVTLDVGATLAFWQGDPKRLLDDIADARPMYLPSVPRVFEKIHARALGAVEEASPVRRRRLRVGRRHRRAAARGRAAGRDGRPRAAGRRRTSPTGSCCPACASCSAASCALGLTGAAPIGREVLEFFDACGVLVLEGYGMTETCAAATLNTPGRLPPRDRRPRRCPAARSRSPSDGEILMRGPHVFGGYHHDEDATGETFDDGWLRVGRPRRDRRRRLPRASPAARRTSSSRRAARTSARRTSRRRCARRAGSRRPSSSATTGRTSSRC